MNYAAHSTKHRQGLLPVRRRLFVIGADSRLVVMADAHLVGWTAHLQAGVLGDVQAWNRTQRRQWLLQQTSILFKIVDSGNFLSHANKAQLNLNLKLVLESCSPLKQMFKSIKENDWKLSLCISLGVYINSLQIKTMQHTMQHDAISLSDCLIWYCAIFK